jgi:hypothetical protein
LAKPYWALLGLLFLSWVEVPLVFMKEWAWAFVVVV